MQQYVRDKEGSSKLRSCCSEPSRREFAVRDLHAQPHSQFGPRVHVDPNSEGCKAYMHDAQGGWFSSCDAQVGWEFQVQLLGGQQSIGQMGVPQKGPQMAT
eukprot:2403227-Karenia_brevis.AAC.2